jgi:hypothetical protein
MNRAARLRQDILHLVADALRAWARGDGLAAGELHDAIDSLPDDELAAERNQTISHIRLNDE